MADKLTKLAKEKKRVEKTKIKVLKKEFEKQREKEKQILEKEEEEVAKEIEKENRILSKSILKSGNRIVNKYYTELSLIQKKINTLENKITDIEKSGVLDDKNVKLVTSLENQKSKLINRKTDLELFTKKIETELKSEGRGSKNLKINKIMEDIEEFSGEMEILEEGFKSKKDELDGLVGDDDKTNKKRDFLMKSLKKIKAERDEITSKRSLLMNELVSLEEEDVTKDEEKVLILIKDIITLRDEALSKDQKISISNVRQKLKEFSDNGELSEENKNIFNKIFDLKKDDLLNFMNLYLKKDVDFFQFLPEYLSKKYTKTEAELKSLDKKELLGLLQDSNMPGKYKTKDKDYLISLLLKKRCDPEMEIFCDTSKDEVCNVITTTCQPRPTEIPKGWDIKLYKGSYLFGPYRTLNEYYRRLRDMLAIEKKKLEALQPKRRKIPSFEERKVSKLVTKLINSKGEVVEVDDKDVARYTYKLSKDPLSGRSCFDDFSKKPWIEGYVSTYIVNADGSKPESKFLTRDEVEYKNNTFYAANKVFDLLNCNQYSKQRRQIGNVLKVYDENGREYNFILLHQIRDNKYKLQTEELFSRELEWINLNLNNFLDKAKYYLGFEFTNSELNAIVRSLVVSELERKLNEISKTSDTKKIAEEIERNIRESITSFDTIADYLRKVSEITIFLDENNKLYTIGQPFIKKLANSYFNYSSLPELSLTEKLGYIYNNPDISDSLKSKLSTVLGETIERKLYEYLRKVFMTLDPSAKSIDLDRFLPQINYSVITPLLGVKPILADIEVADKGNYADWEYEYFIDKKGDIYAFIVFTLLNNFMNGDFLNPFTNEPFSEEFIQNIIRKYDLTNMLFGGPIDDITGEEVENLEKRSEKLLEKYEREQEKIDTIYSIFEDSLRVDEERLGKGEEFEELSEYIEEEEKELSEGSEEEKKELLEEKEEEEEEEKELLEASEEEEEDYFQTTEDDKELVNHFYSYLKAYFGVDDDNVKVDAFFDDYSQGKGNILAQFYNYLTEDDELWSAAGIYDAEEIIEKFENNENQTQEERKDFCDYCNKKLEEEMFKSAVKKDKGSEIVKFCSTKCFEDSPFRKRT